MQYGLTQFGHGQIQHGVELAARDAQALLLFSGGQTRTGTHLSEAQSYLDAAQAHDFWGHYNVAARATTEEFARDSYENVVFGVARFFECTKSFPQRLTIVSWRFKQARFVHHAMSIRWPLSRFAYSDMPNPEGKRLAPALVHEERTLQAFQRDPTGSLSGGVLQYKKDTRNPYRRQHGYFTSCPNMTSVLQWTGTTKVPDQLVPWTVQ